MKIIDGYLRGEVWSEAEMLPIGHPTLSDHYRVPVHYEPPDNYTVYVGKHMSRLYTTESMPDYVKVKITIANARGETVMSDDQVATTLTIFDSARYISEEMRDIAWRVSPSIYVVVLEKVELFKLRGEI